MRNRCHWLAAILWIATIASPLRAADWSAVEEHWYVMEIAGQKAGWMSVKVEDDGEHYRTTIHTKLTVGRGAATTTIEQRSTVLETHDGRAISMRHVQDMARQSMDTSWEFAEDHVVQTSRQGGRELVKEHALPEGIWLTPMAINRYWLERREAGAKEIIYRTLTGESGLQPVDVRSVLTGEESFEYEGRSIPATVWTTRTTMIPIDATEKYSSDGHLLYQEVATGIGTMVMRIQDKARAQAPAVGGGPELLAATFVKPDKPIRRSDRTRRATLRVRAINGDLIEFPTAGAQRATMAEGGESVLLEVDINDNVPADPGDAGHAAYLETSSTVDSADPLIAKLTSRAVRNQSSDPLARAEAMRAFVHRYISRKGLQTAFATASETARMRQGDCSEHAVLLCAMLRADGIPARVASGLIYADSFAGARDIFGWHMWTQALVDGRWVDFDATLRIRYNAAHVLTGTSDLADGGMGAEIGIMIALMGNIEIEIVDIDYD